jgi:HK97 family phage major capsid protein
VVDQDFRPDPVALGRVPFSLLDVIPVRPHGTQEYAFLRQTTRTNNAAVVAENAVKPTSIYSVTRVEQSLQVIAHLSEPIPRYWLLDNDQLSRFVMNELNYGLRLAIEGKIITDINATSGIQLQTYGTSIPIGIRKALTKLEAAGYTAASIVVAPADFETVELALSTTNAVERIGLPYDPAQRRLYGVQVVVFHQLDCRRWARAGT